jgi:hypothetical protein
MKLELILPAERGGDSIVLPQEGIVENPLKDIPEVMQTIELSILDAKYYLCAKI